MAVEKTGQNLVRADFFEIKNERGRDSNTFFWVVRKEYSGVIVV